MDNILLKSIIEKLEQLESFLKDKKDKNPEQYVNQPEELLAQIKEQIDGVISANIKRYELLESKIENDIKEELLKTNELLVSSSKDFKKSIKEEIGQMNKKSNPNYFLPIVSIVILSAICIGFGTYEYFLCNEYKASDITYRYLKLNVPKEVFLRFKRLDSLYYNNPDSFTFVVKSAEELKNYQNK